MALVGVGVADDVRAQSLPAESRALRVALEEVAVLLAGTGYYFMQHEVNSQDWTFDYSWDTVEAKLNGDGYSFDTNYFKTNTLAHSGAGTLYYVVARGNYLLPSESLAVGFFSSAAWEFLAEFRERISINDQMVTPFGGFAFGEAMTQVGRLFMRGCDSTLFNVLGTVFAPSERLHRSVDGTALARGDRCNASGFSTRDDYLVRLGVGASFDGDWSAPDNRGWLLGHAEVHVLDVPRGQTVQNPWHAFYDGGPASLSVRLQAAGDGIREVDVLARGSLLGAAYRDLTSSTLAVLALGAGVNYSERRYATAADPRDPFFVLEAPALLAQWRRTFGSQRVDFGLVVGGAFVQAGAFALPVYLEHNTTAELTPVVAGRGYTHAFGLTLNPHVRWSSSVHEAWVGARVDRAWGVRSRVGDQLTSSPVEEGESRRRLRASLSLGTDERWRLRTEADWVARRGTLGDAQRLRRDLTLTVGVEGRF